MLVDRLSAIMEPKVSMKSGLEGRNNGGRHCSTNPPSLCLNEVRPRRPEQ